MTDYADAPRITIIPRCVAPLVTKYGSEKFCLQLTGPGLLQAARRARGGASGNSEGTRSRLADAFAGCGQPVDAETLAEALESGSYDPSQACLDPRTGEWEWAGEDSPEIDEEDETLLRAGRSLPRRDRRLFVAWGDARQPDAPQGEVPTGPSRTSRTTVGGAERRDGTTTSESGPGRAGMWVRTLAVMLALLGVAAPAYADPVDDLHAEWKRSYLLPADDGQLRVALAKDGPQRQQTVSEGQGYGMLITVALGTRAEFDALWAFAREHPSDIDPRLMDWKVPERINGNDSAFDGDADMAYSLVLAHRRWGGAYLRDARTVIAGLAESAVGPRSRLPLLGDWVLRSASGYTQWHFRSSDCMPATFAAFGEVMRTRFWRSVTRACVGALAAQSRSTGSGLVSDFLMTRPSVRAVRPGFLEGPADGQYSYNAGRVPWRLALGGARAREVAARISDWARRETGGDPLALRAGYTLGGRPAAHSDYFTSFFAAPLAVAAGGDPSQQAWARALLAAVRDRRENYYEDSVTLLCLLASRQTTRR